MGYSQKLHVLLLKLLPKHEVGLLVHRANTLGYVGDEIKMKKIYDTIYPYRRRAPDRYRIERLIKKALGEPYRLELYNHPEIASELSRFFNRYFRSHPRVALKHRVWREYKARLRPKEEGVIDISSEGSSAGPK